MAQADKMRSVSPSCGKHNIEKLTIFPIRHSLRSMHGTDCRLLHSNVQVLRYQPIPNEYKEATL